MRYSLLLLLIFLAPWSMIFADNKDSLPYPVWGQSLGVYNIFVISADAKEYRNSTDYDRNRTISLIGELKLGDHFSVNAGYGYVDQYATQTTSWSGWDRWRAGLKTFFKFGILSVGGGVHVYGPSVSEPWMGERNPDLFLVRPHLGFALDFGKTKFQAYALYERETDSHFKDPIQDKMYRYMEAGGTISYDLDEKWILLAEVTYRLAVEDTISVARSDSFNLHPGFQYKIGEGGRLFLSGLYGLRKDNTYDQGFKVGYQQMFGTED
ncbi:hypothetical protein [Leptospira sarikeiensis]|uniref:Uncharacterized protein n=1 Tax=Leptospira sarikeiensis TaxID=2484943 RepID=A0A4R9KF44_9LEPT|nr:hypothetical protein [Leptospira sarikeiensis]TGL64911.1 hypothetical protein EHQ64_01185 [Leptospira sarikeiensis]